MNEDEKAKEIVDALLGEPVELEPIEPSGTDTIFQVLVGSNPIRHTVVIAALILFVYFRFFGGK